MPPSSAASEEPVPGAVIAALEENRLLLLLQPVVGAASGKPVFYEALLRLRRSDGTLVAAADFVEEAEKAGLAHLVDQRTLELAVPLLARHPGLKLSLNISSLTAAGPDWIAALTALAGDDPDLPRRLIVEITETAMIHDLDRVAAFIDLLRALGCRVAIDDFGAGYTSFRHLRTLKVDILKIDGQFVTGLPDDHKDRVLVKTMIGMAEGLGLETVAEWVADEESAAFLRAAGATYLQGFLYGAPAPAEDLARQGLL